MWSDALPALSDGTLDDEKLRMYALIKESVPVGLGANAIGHISLATFFAFKDDPVMRAWATSRHFRKVTCIVSDEEFERAKEHPDFCIMTEDAIGDVEIALGFKPMLKWPRFFRSLRLFGSHLQERKDENILNR